MDVQLYVNVDDVGVITDAYSGRGIVVTEEYNYYFIAEEEIVENIFDYKVVIESMKPKLVKKDAE